MEYNPTIEKMAESRTWYTFTEKTTLGGRMIVEVVHCKPDNTSKNSLPNIWHKNGHIDRILPHYWSVSVYAYDDRGHCWNMFNPQIIPGQNKINFDWLLGGTKENLQKLLDEVCRLAYEA